MKARFILTVFLLIASGHAQSNQPEAVVQSAIANYFVDVRTFHNYVCDVHEHVVSHGPGGKRLYEQTVTYEWILADGKLYRWVINPADGSYVREFPPIAMSDARPFDTNVPLKEIPALYRIHSVRQREWADRPVWEVVLSPRAGVKWPKGLTHFSSVRMWIDQGENRILRLAYTASGERCEYVFTTSHPGLVTATHAELVRGPWLRRMHSTVDHTFEYKRFGASVHISMP